MMIELVFLWLYWVCHVAMWYFRVVERDEEPFRLRVASLLAYGAGTVGMLLYLTRVVVPGAAPVWWFVLFMVIAATLADNLRSYGEVVRKSYPVPPGVKRAAAVFECSVEFVLQVPCMVVLYRLARGISPP